MSYAVSFPHRRAIAAPILEVLVAPLRVLHLFVSLPVTIFLLTLASMLFRPPDLKCFPIDRIGFFALVLWAVACLCIRREPLTTYPATWPFMGLLLLGAWGVVTQPYDPQAWSVFAAKWAVPFVLFHVSRLIFRGQRSLRQLEVFLLAALVYLTVISLFSLLNVQGLIFPRYITDESIGIHADRARGPFLQAVANGLCLNLLGLIALDSFRRKSIPPIVSGTLFLGVPFALLATRTRAVWISAAVSATLLCFVGSTRRLRRAANALCVMTAVGGIVTVLTYHGETNSLFERTMDRSPVDFRTEMYRAGWQMFTEKPLFGWGDEAGIQAEIEKRVSSFHPEYYVFHNTFLELAVQRGMLGTGLYVWLMICLFRLRKSEGKFQDIDGPFSGAHFRKLWPMLLLVYLLNASAVVLNYQFVNAVMFTIAGILASQRSLDHRRTRISVFTNAAKTEDRIPEMV